jgi:hypothetical protein
MSDALLQDLALLITANLGLHTEWVNRWETTPIAQQVTNTLDGNPVIEYLYPVKSGREMVVDCSWLSKTELENLVTLRDRPVQNVMMLTFCDGTRYEVIWDHAKGKPIETIPGIPRPDYDFELWPDVFITKIFLLDAGFGPITGPP